MQFRAFEPGVEVVGHALSFTMSGFRITPSVGMRYLQRFGLTRAGADGKPQLVLEDWYPHEKWLACFEAIYRDIGANITFEIGRQLGANYPIPPDIADVHAAIRWLDCGYHLAHRKNGRPMLDPNTNRMVEGIGHYGYRREGERHVVSVCENPYPCELDLGIETGLAARFAPKVAVTHAEGECRKRGGDRCTYDLRW